MIDFKEIQDGEKWELFCRDFLLANGFYIESPPNRGADGGKDLLVTEELTGKLHKRRFRWLVSCKHHAASGNSVSETEHERNILERIKAFKAHGFIGFYSTLASSGLNTRLEQLLTADEIESYRIFDGKLIENTMLGLGFSRLLLRYFPESYKKIRPLHNIFKDYVPLECDYCKKDLLRALDDDEYSGVVSQAQKLEPDDTLKIEHVYVACKGECDKCLERMYFDRYGLTTAWHDISDMAMPNEYLRWVVALMNNLRDPKIIYSKAAFEKEKLIVMTLAQKVFREVTSLERKRFTDLVNIPF
jgi:hypothetical protein